MKPAGPSAEQRLENQLCFALYSASRAITRAYAPLLDPLGLTYPQYVVMLVLWSGDDLPVNQLGERLGLDSATLTPLLKRLEARKLVSRVRDAADQRVVRIRVTSDGWELMERARGIPSAIACQAGFDPNSEQSMRELFALRDELKSLTERIG